MDGSAGFNPWQPPAPAPGAHLQAADPQAAAGAPVAAYPSGGQPSAAAATTMVNGYLPGSPAPYAAGLKPTGTPGAAAAAAGWQPHPGYQQSPGMAAPVAVYPTAAAAAFPQQSPVVLLQAGQPQAGGSYILAPAGEGPLCAHTLTTSGNSTSMSVLGPVVLCTSFSTWARYGPFCMC
jgi:hypothetical protein